MIRSIESSGLKLLHRGKVRDSFRVDARTRLLIATDRISAFDLKLKTLIPRKGEVLSRLSAYWFEQTRDIIPNHFIRLVDPQASLVHEATPLRIEMVVRGYICGTLWRVYDAGRRDYSGVRFPERLTENAKLDAPVLTPTTKEDSDEEITPEAILARGLVSASMYTKIESAALALFARGASLAAQRGLILADTKYEFGVLDGEAVLIDEIHTPDSSRYWDAHAYAQGPQSVASIDKEYVRQWMRAQAHNGALPLELSPDVAAETSKRYCTLYERVVGAPLPPLEPGTDDTRLRLQANLRTAGILNGTLEESS
jgi:phosphoribosylaminoimidazole-succinocarboxamide synthase